jgi:phosphohistidine phosphatase
MDLILWRHADAEDGADDLRRELTAKGRKQAARVAQWLLAHLPEDFEVVASPATRAQQTAEALAKKFKTEKPLAPGAPVQAILKAAGWPGSENRRTVVVVGHQPDLGRAAAHLLAGKQADWHTKKGGLWWLSSKNDGELIVRAVVSPDLLQ